MGIITNIQQNAYDDSGIQSEIDSIGAKVTTLVGTDDNKSVRTIANEELAAQLIPEGAKDSLDTLTEIAAWIQSHPDDASAMNAAIEALQAKVDTGDKTVSAYVTDAIAALSIGDYAKASDLTALAGRVSTLETTSATHATKTALEAEVSERTDADTALSNRITTLETAVGESGSVATDIAAAKDEAISTAAADATAKANQALTDAKAHTNTEVGKDRTRLDALEADTHTHSNKTLLDTYTQTEVNLADAVTKKHSHANSAVLDGIDSAKVTAWDKVTSKADTTALTDEVNRATAKEAALESAINDMVEASEEEVKALFATA